MLGEDECEQEIEERRRATKRWFPIIWSIFVFVSASVSCLRKRGWGYFGYFGRIHTETIPGPRSVPPPPPPPFLPKRKEERKKKMLWLGGTAGVTAWDVHHRLFFINVVQVFQLPPWQLCVELLILFYCNGRRASEQTNVQRIPLPALKWDDVKWIRALRRKFSGVFFESAMREAVIKSILHSEITVKITK